MPSAENHLTRCKEHKPKSNARFWVVLLLFFNLVVNYIDRVNLSVAAPVIAKQFHWDPARMGWIFSAYLWTYALCLIPSGWLADQIGARRTSAIAISVWSSAAMLTGAVNNFATMLAARLGLGIGEATSIPVCNKVVRQWFPAEERGFATALFHSGVFISIAAASPLVAWLVLRVGWRVSFVISGSLGLVWLLFWMRWFRSPEECMWLPDDERQFILDSRDGNLPSAPDVSIVARQTGILEIAGFLLRQQTMWGLALTLGCVNYMNYLFLSWLPSYMVQARGMFLMRAGIYSAVPYLVGVILEISFGKLSDWTLTPEHLKQGKRRNQVVAFLLLSSTVLLINVVHSLVATLAVISIVLACNTTAIMFVYALTNDLIVDREVTGTAFGILLLGGNLIGLAAPIVTGYVVKATRSFNSAFAISGALSLIGAVMAFAFTRRALSAPDRTDFVAALGASR